MGSGWGRRGWGLIDRLMGIGFLGDENVLKLDGGVGYIIW